MAHTPTVHNPTNFEPAHYQVEDYLDNKRPTATDPTKMNLAQADLLRRLVEAGPAGLPRDRVPFTSLVALERRGLVRLLTEPTGQDHPAWRQTWLATDLGRQVLAGGLVHTDTERDADGRTHLFVFLNGKQCGEVRYEAECYPPLGVYGRKYRPGWLGHRDGDDPDNWEDFTRKDHAVAWVAGGAR